MPAKKRKITVSKKSAFWPCGSCRQNCTTGIQCDACKQWFHAQCEGLSDNELNFLSGSTAPYTCDDCFTTELGSSSYDYRHGLIRMRQWCVSNGVDNMQIAARREAKRLAPFVLYGRPPINGEFVEQDMNAQNILNKCRLANLGVPSMTTGDGNCLFNAVSIALTGDEDIATELRLRTSVEMALNANAYTCRVDYDQLMTHSPSYHDSMKDCCTEGAYSSIWTIMALSSVIGLPIKSVYPAMNGPQCKTHHALSKHFTTEENANRETVTILWSRMGPWRRPNWMGNHFVPVLKQQETTALEIDTPAPSKKGQFQPTEISTPFKQKELRAPASSFLIKDILGNEIKVTQVVDPNDINFEF